MAKKLQMSRGVVYVYDDAAATAVDGWMPDVDYVVGDCVYNWEPGATANLPLQVYKCITLGTSASSGGPTGVGADITDGTAHWQRLAPRALGVVSKMTLGMESTEKKHYDWSAPTAQLDASAEDRRDGSIELTLDEFSLENIALAGIGTLITDTGDSYVEVGNAGRVNKCFMFMGRNATGPKFQVLVPRASLLPMNKRELISEEFNTLACKGAVYASPAKGGFWQETFIA
jgi:hypothetical protein